MKKLVEHVSLCRYLANGVRAHIDLPAKETPVKGKGVYHPEIEEKYLNTFDVDSDVKIVDN